MARAVQSVLSAVHGVEHLVSALQGTQMVHVVCVRPGLAMVAFLQLSVGRLVASGMATLDEFRGTWCFLPWSDACFERINAAY